MSMKGTVYHLGYVPHEGPRLGRSGAMTAIVKDGVRRALGLRRKPREKLMPWLLIGAAVVPATVIVSLTFFLEEFNLGALNPFGSHGAYFEIIGTLSLLFVAFVTPTLLIPDRIHGVLEIYASRPVRAADYLLARAVALALLTSLFILIPHVTLYIGIGGLHEEGLWAGLLENVAEVPPILGSTLAFVVGYGAPAFLISVYVARAATASGLFILVMLLTVALTAAIPSSSDAIFYKYLTLLSMSSNPLTVRDWLFDLEASTPVTRAGLPSWAAAVALLAFAALTAVLAHRRYRSEL